MRQQRPIPVLVRFGGKTARLAVSAALAEACRHQLPAALCRSLGEAICESDIEGQLALELAACVDRGLACPSRRAVATEDAAYLIAAMLPPHDWRGVRLMDLQLRETASPTRLDLTLVLTRGG